MRQNGFRRGTTRRRVVAPRPAAVRLGAVAGGLAACLLLVAACGSDSSDTAGGASGTGDATNATEVLGPVAKAAGEPVRIGLVSDGKAATVDQSVEIEAGKATVAYLNEHRSGIAGRPIELVTCASQADPGITADCANRMIEQDVAAVVIGGVAAQESAWTPLHDAGIPVILYSTSATALLADAKSTFSFADATFGTIGLPLKVAQKEGVKKVTAVVIDVPAAKGALEASAPAIYKKAGIEFELVAVPIGTADMTPQMQQIAKDDGEVFILGNDSFCISALNGLNAVGFTGPISAIAQCVTDSTRTAISGDQLKGISISAIAPVGTDNPSTRLYNAIAATYGKNIDTSKIAGINIFTAVAGLQTALEDLTGEVTPATIINALKTMPEKELPGSGGQKFQCGGKAASTAPASCVQGGLISTLDDKGYPTSYEVAGA
ncbi:ABC transporter substrate-binding protein [Parafrankia sp. EUN1f]|uniref:ABC transporter substrate-binding protein n=1 Tax=Parafrankia sp. EUN1f TaxID=102897 RepID=UPI0001C45A8C|nr:ABC-type branched-chain amino acid transport systems periplasmic component-like protein [Parafrankia sp. EUN1f]